jgi:hypothetical protein
VRTRWPIGTLSPPNWRSGLGKLRNAQTVCRYSDNASAIIAVQEPDMKEKADGGSGTDHVHAPTGMLYLP